MTRRDHEGWRDHEHERRTKKKRLVRGTRVDDRFSSFAYGDTRSGSTPGVPGDGDVLLPEHSRVVDRMIVKAGELGATPFPARFVLQSGDAVQRGPSAAMWKGANLPYFFFGNTFFVAFDSNIASDPIQLAWVTDQLEQLDRVRYHHVIAFFHHPPFSCGPHGGASAAPVPGTGPAAFQPYRGSATIALSDRVS